MRVIVGFSMQCWTNDILVPSDNIYLDVAEPRKSAQKKKPVVARPMAFRSSWRKNNAAPPDFIDKCSHGSLVVLFSGLDACVK